MTVFWEHPDYKANKERWQLWRNLHSPKREVITGPEYLWYTNLERKSPPSVEERSRIGQIRRDRETRSRYLAIPRMIVSIWQSTFLKSPPTFNEQAIEFFKAWGIEQDVDGKGTSFKAFLRDSVLKSYLVYGKVAVLADAYGIHARSLGEQRALGLRPYLEVIEPLAMRDWEIEETLPARVGRYNMIRHEFDAVKVRDADASIEPLYERYCNVHKVVSGRYIIEKYKTPIDAQGGYAQIDKDTGQATWQMIGKPIETKLAEIPVAVIDSDSWIEDVCEETLRHYNLRSIKDSTEFNQGFQRVFVKGVNTSDPKAVAALSEYIVGALPQDGGVEVVEAIGTGDLRASVQEAAESAIKIGLDQQRRLSSDSLAAQSQEAQAQEQDPTFALVKSTLAEIEAFMNKALANMALFTNVKDFKGAIALGSDIKPEDVPTWLTVWDTFKEELQEIPEVRKAVLKRALSKLNLPDNEKLALQVDALPDRGKEQQALRTAILSRAINGERTPG